MDQNEAVDVGAVFQKDVDRKLTPEEIQAANDASDQRRGIRRIKYRCANEQCDAEDVLKLVGEEPVPMIINCWKCGAGRGLTPPQMLGQAMGMVKAEDAQVVGQGVDAAEAN